MLKLFPSKEYSSHFLHIFKSHLSNVSKNYVTIQVYEPFLPSQYILYVAFCKALRHLTQFCLMVLSFIYICVCVCVYIYMQDQQYKNYCEISKVPKVIIFICLSLKISRLNSSMLVVLSCPILCDPMGYSPPGSSIHRILKERMLEWVGIPFSRGFSQPRDQTQVSCIAGRFFTV